MPTVTPEVAAKLFEHLKEQGRSRGTVNDLGVLLATAAQRAWGTAKTRGFRDSHGSGWLIDLADHLDGEELYALVRPSMGGARMMLAVVDADELTNFDNTKEWQTPAARGNVEDPAVMAAVDEMNGGVPSAAAYRHPTAAGPVASPVPEYDPKDPMLVVVTYAKVVGSDESAECQEMIRATREEVPGVVKMLLSQGVDGTDIAEGNIEVWSSMSQPKVEVRF